MIMVKLLTLCLPGLFPMVYSLNPQQQNAQHGICRFSPLFSQEEISRNSTGFESNIFYWEGQYHQDSIGYLQANGMTINHIGLGYATGLPSRQPSVLQSDPRNEAYHIMLLTLAINGSSQASTFIYNANPSDAAEIAAAILTSKLATYLDFNNTYPGYGGFLPSFEKIVERNDHRIRPTNEWHGRLSAADNGQLVWAVYGAINALILSNRPEFQKLGVSWVKWFYYARDNAKDVFMKGPSPGDVCAISTLFPDALPHASEQHYACEKNDCLNNDPFEGELMSWFLHFSNELSQAEIDNIWEQKRSQLVAMNYTGSVVDTSNCHYGTSDYTGDPIVGRHITPITIQKGLYFGSNEQMKLLFMPYLDVELVSNIYKNAERVRTCNSVLMGRSPGLYASTPNATSPTGDVLAGNTTLGYELVDNAGIPSAAFSREQELDVITPYSVFPILLFERSVGLAWYKTMLDGKQMQTVYGSLAGTRRDGSAVARFVGWQTKAPTLLALVGGIVDIVRDGMRRDNIYDEFINVTTREYSGVFERPLMGTRVGLCMPNAQVPDMSLNDFSSCSSQAAAH